MTDSVQEIQAAPVQTAEQLDAQIKALMQARKELELSNLPDYPVRILVYADKEKETIAEIAGSLRQDQLWQAIGDTQVAFQYAMTGRKPEEVKEVGAKARRLFIVIDCGLMNTPVQAPETPPEAPTPPDQPQPQVA